MEKLRDTLCTGSIVTINLEVEWLRCNRELFHLKFYMRVFHNIVDNCADTIRIIFLCHRFVHFCGLEQVTIAWNEFP